MAIQSTLSVRKISQQSQVQTYLATLWNQLSPEQQKQVAKRLAELIQRMRIPPAPATEKKHEDQ